MAIIKTQVKDFNGYRANVMFRNGVGRTDDTRLIEWFKTHGYIVDEYEPEKKNIEDMNSRELRNVCKEKGIAVGNTKDRDKLLEKLKEVM